MKKIALLLALAMLFVTACGGGGTTLDISANDQMQFSTNKLEAKTGEQVTLRLRHSGQMPLAAMGHNVVILKPGTDIEAFSTAAIAAGAGKGYIPDELKGSVIANTETIGGGKTTEVKFTAPAPGTYPFICSFPGHSGLMRGEFVVTP